MQIAKYLSGIIFTALTACFATIASAQEAVLGELETVGKPEQDGLNFQPAATELMRDIVWFDSALLWYIGFICLLVTGLLIYVIVRYNAKANPVPSTTTHNTPLEITWIVIPAASLVLLAFFFSMPILFKQLRIPEADVTIKATGNQWYWSYDYVDHDFTFDSFMLQRDELADAGYADDEFLLATDTAIVIPVNKTVVMQITGSDVIHAWTIPSFGVKQDAVPGRLAELWFKAEREGVYFGQCSELCGKDHSYMPITVKVVSEEKYNAWLEGAVEEYAGDPLTLPGVDVASAQ
jgi:cytochrome c oxidase subunit 2